jgi:hypothetical protein
MEKYLEQIMSYFKNNPSNVGYVIILLGAVIIYGAYKDWAWIFEGGGRTINIGWISDTFGRKAARNLLILLGLIFVLGGGFWSYKMVKTK